MICKDCKDTYPMLFMLKQNVWDKVCEDKEDLLCLECTERRLGRSLTIDDFEPDVKINDLLFFGYRLGKES